MRLDNNRPRMLLGHLWFGSLVGQKRGYTGAAEGVHVRIGCGRVLLPASAAAAFACAAVSSSSSSSRSSSLPCRENRSGIESGACEAEGVLLHLLLRVSRTGGTSSSSTTTTTGAEGRDGRNSAQLPSEEHDGDALEGAAE